MRVVIAGSRDITDYELVKQAIAESGFNITEVVCGCARGVDKLGERWAKENNIPIKYMMPDWDKYGKRAGYLRNADMVKYAAEDEGGVIAVWNGSPGTKHTIDLGGQHNLPVFIKKV